MAAGLGFKDFVTGEVLTAADVDGYLMQGIWVFASAAARDSAVTSPQEGNFAYLKDTNTTTYYTGSAWTNLDTTGMVNPMTTTGDTIYSSSGSTPARLGIGSTGQVLTVAGGVPSWATPATGGMTLLDTMTLSGTSVTSATFSSAYNQLVIYMKKAYISAGSNDLAFRLNGDSGSNYTYSGNRVTTTTNGTSTGSAQTLSVFGVIGNKTTDILQNYAIITLMRPKDTDVVYTEATSIGHDENSVRYSQRTSGIYDSSAAITSFTLLTPSADTFSGGTVYIYGVN